MKDKRNSQFHPKGNIKHTIFLFLGIFIAIALIAGVVIAGSYTQYPPYGQATGSMNHGEWGLGRNEYHLDLNITTGQLYQYAMGEGVPLAGNYWASVYGYMGTNSVPMGTPYISVWNGSNYIESNDILPASIYYNNNIEVIDYCNIMTNVVEENSKYKLQITEDGSTIDYLNNVALLAIDHDINQYVGIAQNNEIIVFQNTVDPISSLSNGEDVLNEVIASDYNFYDGYTNSVLYVDFLNPQTDENAALILNFEGSSKPFLMKAPLVIQVCDPIAGWVDVAEIFPRADPVSEVVLVPLASISTPTLQFKLTFGEVYHLDSVKLATQQITDFSVKTCKLISAIKSNGIDVSKALSKDDDTQVVLTTGNSINLAFKSPPQQKLVRSFIFVSKGYYQYANQDNDGFIPSGEDPIVTVAFKVNLKGNAKVYALSPGFPYAAYGSWNLKEYLYAWDDTSKAWVTQSLMPGSQSDYIYSTGGYGPAQHDTTWSGISDNDFSGTFSATSGHKYIVYFVAYIDATGCISSPGDGFGRIDLHTYYGSDSITVKYIHCTW